MTKVISELDSAKVQTSCAIRLFLEENYICAITLAKAAEGCLKDSLTSKTTHKKLNEKLASQFGMTEAEFSDVHLNYTANYLKHGKPHHRREDNEIDIATDAMQYIFRALNDILTASGSLPYMTKEFLKWTIQNRPDVLSEKAHKNIASSLVD